MAIQTAEVITIGDEILIGQITDTNTQFVSAELNKLGIDVVKKSSVGDSQTQIMEAITEAFGRADLLVLTGGLGPTKDDITKHTLCEYFGSKLVLHEPTLARLALFFEKRNRPFTDTNRQQAYVPEICQVLDNVNGTAPGMWITHKGKVLVSLPGVPFEMKALMIGEVCDRLKQHLGQNKIYHKTILTAGIGESMLSDMISEWEAKLPAYVKLAYLPSYGSVRLRLTAKGVDEASLKKEVNLLFEEIYPLINAYLASSDYDNIEDVLSSFLSHNGLTLATAESCTGGGLAAQLVQKAGSSQYFKGGIVAYSNEVKMNILKVSEETLQKHGAVSEACVVEMAQNLKNIMHCDIGIAVSGIAGPGGGSIEKPVGTIWIACSYGSKTITKKITGGNLRETNIKLAIQQSLFLAWSLLNTGE